MSNRTPRPIATLRPKGQTVWVLDCYEDGDTTHIVGIFDTRSAAVDCARQWHDRGYSDDFNLTQWDLNGQHVLFDDHPKWPPTHSETLSPGR